MSDELLPVAILAGGLATRLRPLSHKIPKSLVDIGGEAFIVHQLRLLRESGITKITICAGYLGEMIEELLGNGLRHGVEVSYSFDGPSLRGTAGAIKQALPLLGESFFVLYGDSYLPCDYRLVQAAFVNLNLPTLMTVFRNEGRWDSSNVEYSNCQILDYDKANPHSRMHHIDYGLSVCHRSVFDEISLVGAHDLAPLYKNLLVQGRLAGYEVSQRFYEIGSFAGLEDLREYFAARQELSAKVTP